MNYRPFRNPNNKQHEFNDVNLLTMAASSLKMKSFGHTTELYGDSFTYSFFKTLNLLEIWDKVDGISLEKQIDKQLFDISYFFNIGKFFTLSLVEAPVMLVDTDLIIWDDLRQELQGKEAAFTHWEAVKPVSEWYCQKEELKIPKEYSWKADWDFDTLATNTSVIYFEKNEVKNYYCKEAFKFMHQNFIKETKRVRSELYFVEQRLFPMCLKELGVFDRMKPLIDTLWSPAEGAFIKKDISRGWWDFFIPEPEQFITHTWIAKNVIKANQKYCNYYCCRLLLEILKMMPQIEEKLRQTEMFDQYFQLFDRYGTLADMISEGAASKILYS